MKKKGLLYAAVLSAVFVLMTSTLFADETKELTGRKFAQLAMGGVLYDNWASELGIKVEGNHPSYPEGAKKNGRSTWRCKECHGWDYKGKDGAYSKGSHYTGIKGIRGYAGKDPEKIKAILMNKSHVVSNMVSEDSIDALSLFVAYGQIDVDRYIDRNTRKSAGNPANGERIYMSTCTKCHGVDGKEINFKTAEKPEYIGTLANKNPWETLHKIRWGHPSSQMISLLFLDLDEQLDVLSFSQTLPKK